MGHSVDFLALPRELRDQVYADLLTQRISLRLRRCMLTSAELGKEANETDKRSAAAILGLIGTAHCIRIEVFEQLARYRQLFISVPYGEHPRWIADIGKPWSLLTGTCTLMLNVPWPEYEGVQITYQIMEGRIDRHAIGNTRLLGSAASLKSILRHNDRTAREEC
jgi:hypothetical protein